MRETDEMFKLHLLSVDTLSKVRQAINKVIIGREQLEKHLIKDLSFDILSLAKQLYRSKSTVPESSEPGKVYFSENPAPNLILNGIKLLPAQVEAFNILLKSNGPVEVQDGDADKDITRAMSHPIQVPDDGTNEAIIDLFISVRESAHMTSDLADIFL